MSMLFPTFNRWNKRYLCNGMKIENRSIENTTIMKKTITKFLNESLRKIKQHKELIKKFRFSSYKEEFVITEQEEKEGGYFGNLNYKVSAA